MLNLYQVTVSSAGQPVATHDITASDGTEACNTVESQYGDPAKVTFTQNDQGEKIMIVTGWHGYTFQARQLATIKTAGGDIITRRVQ